MPLLRAFASFDCDRDADLLQRLLRDARRGGAPFLVCDRSTSESRNPACAEKLRERIFHSDLMIVLCGEWTHRATGVAKELRIAQELGKPYFCLKGRRGDPALPTSAKIGDKLYHWTPAYLFRLVTGQR